MTPIVKPPDKDPRSHVIIGAAMEVHRLLGCGFLEAVYQEALAHEFAALGIPCLRECALPVFYKGIKLATQYRADFICYESIVVEIKALDRLGPTEESQILNYLKATSLQVGLLLNFGAKSLEFRRFINSA